MNESFSRVELVGTLIDDFKAVQSIGEDLRFVARAIGEFEARGAATAGTQTFDQVDIVAWALWNAIVVAYARCFNSGSRKAVSGRLSRPADPALAALHENLLNARDGHVAHAGRNSRAEVQQAFFVLVPGNPGVLFSGLKSTFASGSEIAQLRDLVAHYQVALDTLETLLTTELQDRVNSLSIPELAHLAAQGRRLRFDRGSPR
jgi:hypothetical protein